MVWHVFVACWGVLHVREMCLVDGGVRGMAGPRIADRPSKSNNAVPTPHLGANVRFGFTGLSGRSWPGRADEQSRLGAMNLPFAGAPGQKFGALREGLLVAGRASSAGHCEWRRCGLKLSASPRTSLVHRIAAAEGRQRAGFPRPSAVLCPLSQRTFRQSLRRANPMHLDRSSRMRRHAARTPAGVPCVPLPRHDASFLRE